MITSQDALIPDCPFAARELVSLVFVAQADAPVELPTVAGVSEETLLLATGAPATASSSGATPSALMGARGSTTMMTATGYQGIVVGHRAPLVRVVDLVLGASALGPPALVRVRADEAPGLGEDRAGPAVEIEGHQGAGTEVHAAVKGPTVLGILVEALLVAAEMALPLFPASIVHFVVVVLVTYAEQITKLCYRRSF